jgi:Methylase involved in ubiquinone/menaquinone biosynthesis
MEEDYRAAPARSNLRQPVAPHPPLRQYYGDPGRRLAFLATLFDRTAPHYDHIGNLLSFGWGGWYRRRALRRAGLGRGMRVLDVAVGTGAVAREAVAVLGREADVIGIDLSRGMLAEARRRLPIPLVQGRMEVLPFADASVDFVSMGYALRHVGDLGTAFAEFHRVLRPGGKVALLELGRPSTPLRRGLVRLYLGRILPRVVRWTSGMAETETLMRYYWDTIETCVPPDTILGALRAAGFSETYCDQEFDVFRAFVGTVR